MYIYSVCVARQEDVVREKALRDARCCASLALEFDKLKQNGLQNPCPNKSCTPLHAFVCPHPLMDGSLKADNSVLG